MFDFLLLSAVNMDERRLIYEAERRNILYDPQKRTRFGRKLGSCESYKLLNRPQT